MSLLQKPISVLLAVKYSDTRKKEIAVDNLKNCSLVRSIIEITLKSFETSKPKFLTPSNESRSVDLYVKFKISSESVVDDIVKEIKNKTHENLSQVSAFIQD